MKDPHTEPFVPLTATPLPDGRQPDLRVTVLKPEAGHPPFQPLVIAGESRTPAPGFTPRPAAAVCEPRVTVEREGDFVSAIRIQCTCGQTLELACVYESRGAKA
ncbi:MAG TPA: hypothetical protein VI136_13100 [Verrucomicrobiae bacterium]